MQRRTWSLAISGLLICFVYSLPIYLIVAAFASSVTVMPNTQTELIVLGVIFGVAAVPYYSRLLRGDVEP